MLKKGGLHGVEILRNAEAFDGGDLVTLGGDGEGEAGVHATAVEQHGAGATLAVVAPLLAAGQVELLAEEVEERCAGVDGDLPYLPIDRKADRCGLLRGGGALGFGSGGETGGEAGREHTGGSKKLSPRKLQVVLGRSIEVKIEYFGTGGQGSLSEGG